MAFCQTRKPRITGWFEDAAIGTKFIQAWNEREGVDGAAGIIERNARMANIAISVRKTRRGDPRRAGGQVPECVRLSWRSLFQLGIRKDSVKGWRLTVQRVESDGQYNEDEDGNRLRDRLNL